MLVCLLCVASGRSLAQSNEEVLTALLLALSPTSQKFHGKLGVRRASSKPRVLLARSSDSSMEDSDTAGGGASAFSEEESKALYDASVCTEKACTDDYATNNPKTELLDSFTRPQIFFSLLRNPNRDPPEEVWDRIREKWPVLKERSSAELLEALRPIKAKYVDIRML
jgi:hypothetical protein